jgi:hypothetical protein
MPYKRWPTKAMDPAHRICHLDYIKFPFAPVLKASPYRSYLELAHFLQLDYKQVQRYKARGVAPRVGALLVEQLGLNPYDVWGEGWEIWLDLQPFLQKKDIT